VLVDAVAAGIQLFSGQCADQAIAHLVVALIAFSVSLTFFGVINWKWIPKWTSTESIGTDEPKANP
jgi:hypothetical protein